MLQGGMAHKVKKHTAELTGEKVEYHWFEEYMFGDDTSPF